MPAGYFCRINEAPSFGFPQTANISSPGWFLGSTGFHGMASLVVKVPWVAPASAGRRQTRPTASAAATMIFERDLLRGASDISITLASLIAFSFGRGNRKDFRLGFSRIVPTAFLSEGGARLSGLSTD